MNMHTAPASPRTCKNPKIHHLLLQIETTNRKSQLETETRVETARKIYHSSSVGAERKLKMNRRPDFNNRTKEGQLLDKEVKSIPYMFIPAHKNNTFIMPDRVLEKGEAAKRLTIKMKDTSIFSFRQSQDKSTNRTLRKQLKQMTIISRQVEQYTRIINQNDGKRRAEANKWYLKHRKRFTPTNTFQYFSEVDYMLQPKDSEVMELKKTSLAKTFNKDNTWRPFTRGSQSFGLTMYNSIYSNQRETYSVR